MSHGIYVIDSEKPRQELIMGIWDLARKLQIRSCSVCNALTSIHHKITTTKAEL